MTKTINEYILQSGKATPFFDSTNPYNTPSFLRETDFQNEMRNAMSLLYGNYHLRMYYDIDMEQIPTICSYVYSMNSYKYEGLYHSELFEYNPIENYSMTESGTEENSGTDSTTVNKGEQTNDEVLGQRSDSVNHGKHGQSVEEKVSPYETESYKPKTKTETSIDSYSDNITNGEQNNLYTEGAREDRSNTVYGKKTDTNLTRKGNIGVTTSQQMIMSEREVRNFSVIKVICGDLISYLCSRVLEDEY